MGGRDGWGGRDEVGAYGMEWVHNRCNIKYESVFVVYIGCLLQSTTCNRIYAQPRSRGAAG